MLNLAIKSNRFLEYLIAYLKSFRTRKIEKMRRKVNFINQTRIDEVNYKNANMLFHSNKFM